MMIGGRFPVLCDFDPCQVPLWVWQEVKGEAMAVNEADHTSVIVRTEERQQRCEVGVVVRRWCSHRK